MWGLDKIPASVIAPAMIPTPKDQTGATCFLGHGVGAMAAYVVKCSNDVVFSQDEKNGEACKIDGDVVSRLGESTAMSHADPCLIC